MVLKYLNKKESHLRHLYWLVIPMKMFRVSNKFEYKPVWPDLAIFLDFGQLFKAFGNN